MATPDSFINPVFTGYFADPFCWFHEGVYYAVGTGRDAADIDHRTGNVIPMIKSLDLHHWERVGHVLQPPSVERGGLFWAPEVAYDGRRFYMYYHPNGNGIGFHIRCAISDSPQGPYLDTGAPLTNVRKNPFAIDAHAFRDDDGQWYMYYATDFLDADATTFRGTALVVDCMTNMTALAGNPKVVMRAHWQWQIFKRGRDMYGKVADWYTLEGPTVVKRGSRYYLFYSGGCYENDTYGVDYLVSDHPLGPWREVGTEEGEQRGPQVIRTVPSHIFGPGHNSIVTSPPGHAGNRTGKDYIVYHAWNKQFTERQLWVDPLEWTDNGPRVRRFARSLPSDF